jgi:hypothetical protein
MLGALKVLLATASCDKSVREAVDNLSYFVDYDFREIKCKLLGTFYLYQNLLEVWCVLLWRYLFLGSPPFIFKWNVLDSNCEPFLECFTLISESMFLFKSCLLDSKE